MVRGTHGFAALLILPLPPGRPACGADLPNAIAFPATPAQSCATPAILVANICDRVDAFSLAAYTPYTVHPADGVLAPGETLRCSMEFQPQTLGLHEGEGTPSPVGGGRGGRARQDLSWLGCTQRNDNAAKPHSRELVTHDQATCL